jgi:glycosyltransferase involved in cell wall biosynthesis
VTISVVIPCYNAGGFIGEAVRSALGQTRPPDEIIVVDDGSSDNSAEEAAACGPTVRVLRQENRGASAARNAGVQASVGDWIAFLDADDLWDPERLSKLAKLAEAVDSDVVCVFNDMFFLHPGGSRSPRPTPIDLLDGDVLVNLMLGLLVNPSALMVRRRLGGNVLFPEGAQYGEDRQYLVMLRRLGRFVHLSEPLSGYRCRDRQLTAHPRTLVLTVMQSLQFVVKHPEIYTPLDVVRIREHFANSLAVAHEAAYWRRQNDRVRELRRLYFEVCPGQGACPPLFSARLYPGFLLWLKDLVDRVFSLGRSGNCSEETL